MSPRSNSKSSLGLFLVDFTRFSYIPIWIMIENEYDARILIRLSFRISQQSEMDIHLFWDHICRVYFEFCCLWNFCTFWICLFVVMGTRSYKVYNSNTFWAFQLIQRQKQTRREEQRFIHVRIPNRFLDYF